MNEQERGFYAWVQMMIEKSARLRADEPDPPIEVIPFYYNLYLDGYMAALHAIQRGLQENRWSIDVPFPEPSKKD